MRGAQRSTIATGVLVALAIFGGGIAPAARAETIVSQRINATRRLIPLKKITVGPDDQYGGAADPSGTFLVFTHKSDLVPHLCRQELASGEVHDLLPLTADSQESAIGPDGKVAFTYYRFNARGDVCFASIPTNAATPISDEKITCLKPAPGENQVERSNPFWRGPDELGYLVRDLSTQNSQIIAENLKTGARQVLAQGKVWSPAMKAGGRYLFYSMLGDTPDSPDRVLMLKDLLTGREHPIHFALPGISGFPSVSDDEKYLYFSHYLDDTNGDNIIDGSDNSVVFRAPIERLLATQAGNEFFPEQLTSVEGNCSFPRPHGSTVYVSCAFEGSLDIYQIPETGIVPQDWTPAILNNAHQTSRTYAERILLLNTIEYRQHLSGELLQQRLLADHLLADDMTAAKYYVGKLQAAAGPDLKDFYSLLRYYLLAREKKKSQPSAEISREFLSQIQGLEAQVAAVRGQPRFQRIVRGLLKIFIEQPREAAAFLQQVRFDQPGLPLERYLGFELAGRVLPRIRGDGVAAGTAKDPLVMAYKQMAGAPELSEESQIYYAFNLLKYLQQTGDSQDSRALPKRIEAILGVNHGLPPAVDSLLQAEVFGLRIIAAPDDAGKNQAYTPLDQLMNSTREDYYLRKAMYIRAILNFTEAGEFKYMDFMASNWLRYTAAGDTEFIHAREFFAQAELDHAYASWGKKNYQLAGNYFYGSLSLTDDLESHSGYLHAMVLRGMRTTVDERYVNLKQRQFIEDNMKFVEALLLLIDTAPASAQDPGLVNNLDQALAKLLAMEQDRDSSMRYLLLGYCYLQKMMRTGLGLEIDQTLFRDAHRSLMLAYDLGRDNARIKAAVLTNLGILHQRAQNHGLSAKFFSLRKPLGFISSEEAGSFAWLYAHSLYYTHEPEKAAEELAHAPGDVAQAYVGPLLEREAFYRTSAGQYDRAAELYGKLLQASMIHGDMSLAKVNLSYGLCLFKLKRDGDALKALRASLDHAAKLGKLPKDRSRWIDFDPVRIRLGAYGLLSRVGTEGERLEALEKRAELLPDAKKLFDTSYLPMIIENRLNQAALSSRAQPAQAVSRMGEALEFAEQLGDSDLGYLSNAVYRAASEYLAHGWLHPDQYSRLSAERIRKVVEKCIEAYDKQKGAQPLLAYQKLKLQMLWAAYSSKVMSDGKAKQKLEAFASAGGDVQAAMPAQWKELQALSVALAQ